MAGNRQTDTQTHRLLDLIHVNLLIVLMTLKTKMKQKKHTQKETNKERTYISAGGRAVIERMVQPSA